MYELSPKTGYHLLYAFRKSNSGGADGFLPQGNLVFDSAGDLYGTTVDGGIKNTQCPVGCGVVFELTPAANGQPWTETVLYRFCSQANCADGASPQAGVIFDSSGNLYGTTLAGGNQNCQVEGSGCGTVFELQPSQSAWTESVLYAFTGGSAGFAPFGGLALDVVGNVYGTTGATVFELTPGVGGQWNSTIIHYFGQGNGDGNGSVAGVIFDGAGNLYGTAAAGGQFGFGAVFELTPNGSGSWTETILYNFAGGNDGATPESNLTRDSEGSLYGTTLYGGETKNCNGNGCGTVFKLTSQGGRWTESLFRFTKSVADGYWPKAPVLLDATGDVYGTTTSGGTEDDNFGVAFRIEQ